jgi:uncharacterized protein (DUF488 family)
MNPGNPVSKTTRDTARQSTFAEVPTLWTIGYERLLPDALVAELEAAGVRRLLDVRQRPQSRRPGMSKTKLGQRLGRAGIEYEHWRGLGTPVEIRTLYRRGATGAAAAAYREHLEGAAAEDLEALDRQLADGVPTALLCLEAEPGQCHRRQITDALRRRHPDLEVIDL